MIKRIKKAGLALLLATIVSLPTFANQHDEMDRQGQFMAVYLFHFSNFIEWPEAAFQNKHDFNICIDGVTEVNKYIHEIEGENVKGKKIKIKKNVSAADIQNCQILFVSRAGGLKLNQLKDSLQNNSILLVSDKQNFIREGGMIEYFIQDNKLRVAINIDSANKNGLKISSKLLRIAKIVGEN
jgi:YfiR/HmsC-like